MRYFFDQDEKITETQHAVSTALKECAHEYDFSYAVIKHLERNGYYLCRKVDALPILEDMEEDGE